MKPRNVVNISIQGRERTAAQYLRDLLIAAMRLHLDDYRKAGVPVPEDVKEAARKLGVEAEA